MITAAIARATGPGGPTGWGGAASRLRGGRYRRGGGGGAGRRAGAYTQNSQPGGAGGQSGSGVQLAEGSQSPDGTGHPGGGLNLQLTPITSAGVARFHPRYAIECVPGRRSDVVLRKINPGQSRPI